MRTVISARSFTLGALQRPEEFAAPAAAMGGGVRCGPQVEALCPGSLAEGVGLARAGPIVALESIHDRSPRTSPLNRGSA